MGSVWVEGIGNEKSCTETSTVRRSLGQRKQEDVWGRGKGRGMKLHPASPTVIL